MDTQDKVVQDKVVLKLLPSVMGFTIQEMVRDGWEIDPDMPCAQVIFQWECGFIRTPTPEQIAKDAAKASKLSSAESTAKARAAKADKAKGGD